MPALHIMVS